MPEWAKVESPITAATRRRESPSGSTASMPWAMVRDAPMSTRVSIALYGGSTPSE